MTSADRSPCLQDLFACPITIWSAVSPPPNLVGVRAVSEALLEAFRWPSWPTCTPIFDSGLGSGLVACTICRLRLLVSIYHLRSVARGRAMTNQEGSVHDDECLNLYRRAGSVDVLHRESNEIHILGPRRDPRDIRRLGNCRAQWPDTRCRCGLNPQDIIYLWLPYRLMCPICVGDISSR